MQVFEGDSRHYPLFSMSFIQYLQARNLTCMVAPASIQRDSIRASSCPLHEVLQGQVPSSQAASYP